MGAGVFQIKDCMMMTCRSLVAILVSAVMLVVSGGCRGLPPSVTKAPSTGLKGTLLVIGGGLDDDNRDVYERFVTLAGGPDRARIVVATAASGDQEDAARGKIESFRTWCPKAKVDVIRRETTAEETVRLVDQATAMFFTGGDQKRITERYRPGDASTAEYEAIMRLLARGGVIAGTSAGDAMMGDVMFYTGRSAEALGIRSNRTQAGADDDADQKDLPPLGPRIGPGMKMVPWVFTDSHFFERNRVGRLVAAQEQVQQRLGIGVGEDACVEIDLATGTMTGVSVADSLLVDVARMSRDGLARNGCAARVITRGSNVNLVQRLRGKPAQLTPRPAGEPTLVPVVEPGQNRQLASWRLFSQASKPGAGVQRLVLDGWYLDAWPAGAGEVVFDVRPGQP